ncbi:hypothetical protein Actkin_04338 [Actinokineospora sp. UTMC 2448]|nr:hypothetical protein Actkin_04338 [Actinokineospora sp. UTMC 2448]
MTQIPQQLGQLTDLVHAGRLDLAKRQTRELLDTLDPEALDVIARCITILEASPRVALPKLRHYWKTCGDTTSRAIIAACAPTDTPTIPEQRTAPTQSRQRAARDLRTETRPDLRRSPSRTPAQAAALRRAERETNAYQDTRAGVEEGTEPQERPAGYTLDYDRAALTALRGTPCVRCWTERPTADHDRRHDDGLCGECRDRGREGIPVLPEGHTLADAVAARCAFITAHAPAAAHGILRREWTRASTREHRDLIAAWVAAHRDQITPAPAGAVGHAAGHCRACGSYRALRRRRCADCERAGS